MAPPPSPAPEPRTSSGRALGWLGFVAIVIVVGLMLLSRTMTAQLEGIEAWVASLGGWGLVAYVGLFVVLSSCFVPDTLLCIVAGVVFGLFAGAALVAAGALLASVLQYVLARSVVRGWVERALAPRPRLAAVRTAILGEQGRLQVLLRLTPLNPALVSYVLAAGGVRFGPYLLACLALLPMLVLEVWVGYAGRAVADAAEAGAAAAWAHVVSTVVGLVALLLAVVLVSRAAARALADATAEEPPRDDTLCP